MKPIHLLEALRHQTVGGSSPPILLWTAQSWRLRGVTCKSAATFGMKSGAFKKTGPGSMQSASAESADPIQTGGKTHATVRHVDLPWSRREVTQGTAAALRCGIVPPRPLLPNITGQYDTNRTHLSSVCPTWQSITIIQHPLSFSAHSPQISQHTPPTPPSPGRAGPGPPLGAALALADMGAVGLMISTSLHERCGVPSSSPSPPTPGCGAFFPAATSRASA
jgi:hypothetical protein